MPPLQVEKDPERDCDTRAGTVKGHVDGLATQLLGCGTLHMTGGAGLPLSGDHCHLAVVMDRGPQGEAGDGSHPRVLKGTIRAKPNLLEAEESVEQAGHPYTRVHVPYPPLQPFPVGHKSHEAWIVVTSRTSQPCTPQSTDGAGGAGSPVLLGPGPSMRHEFSSAVVVAVDDVRWFVKWSPESLLAVDGYGSFEESLPPAPPMRRVVNDCGVNKRDLAHD